MRRRLWRFVTVARLRLSNWLTLSSTGLWTVIHKLWLSFARGSAATFSTRQGFNRHLRLTVT
jgi:hypothetical protein